MIGVDSKVQWHWRHALHIGAKRQQYRTGVQWHLFVGPMAVRLRFLYLTPDEKLIRIAGHTDKIGVGQHGH